MQLRTLVLGAAAAAAVAAPPWAASTVPLWQATAWDEEIAADGKAYSLTVLNLSTVVSQNASSPPLPAGVHLLPSNNCVGIFSWGNMTFAGFRSAPFHFASNLTQMFIMAFSGGTWKLEATISMDTDVREPHFVVVQNTTLRFSFFSAGTDPLSFDPAFMWYMTRDNNGTWTQPQVWGQPHEVPWQIASTPTNRVYAASYSGDHYNFTANTSDIKVFFNYSDDGVTWTPTNNTLGYTYVGGVSEVGWGFDLSGDFFGVLRNEDGDGSGWGSRIAYATSTDLGNWQLLPSNQSHEYIYESSRIFRHGDELYLVARRDPNGPYWNHAFDPLGFELEHDAILAEYSLHSHRTAIWQLNKTAILDGVAGRDPQPRSHTNSVHTADDADDNPYLSYLFDIPGCGDTAFPSIIRIGKHTYVIANYTSPVGQCADWPWIVGQISPEGTAIYFLVVQFVPATN